MRDRISPSGRKDSRIVLVGEAPGADEMQLGIPFVGKSGQELTRMLADAGIDRKECFITNVFMTRPPNNDIKTYCAKKADVGGKDYTLPPLGTGNYIKSDYLFELDRLRHEIEEIKPNLVIAFGATASWALLQQPKIGAARGTIAESTLVPGTKVLATYHPAAVLRNWSYRAIVIADLMKARGESAFPNIVRPNREIWIEPTIEDLSTFFEKYIVDCSAVTCDIETSGRHITMVGFAPDPEHALVIPFVDLRKESNSYWSAKDEVIAWNFIKYVLSIKPVDGQNFLYDIQHLWYTMGIPCAKVRHDTMLMAHALQPELEKSLGFLGSVYTNEASWKGMKKHSNKRED
jgi:uracil-DNA glycosylase